MRTFHRLEYVCPKPAIYSPPSFAVTNTRTLRTLVFQYTWQIETLTNVHAIQGSRRDQKIKRSRGGSRKRSWVGRWSWAAKVGLLSLRVVPQQQCNGHCLCNSAQARQLKQQLRSAQVAGQWRGDTALTLPLFWRRSTVSPVFFGRYPRSSLHSFVPFPPCPRP